jgi:SAM-dependent methyltransferase
MTAVDRFSGEVAERYDREDGVFAPEIVAQTVDFLAGLAWDGNALELGIGTGRIALPLARCGVHVSGVDLSPDMVARLRAKPGGADVPVAIGDFATTEVGGTFSLAYLVFNTINNLTTQEAQVACFENVARHLRPGGSFVIEVGVPALQRLPPGERYVPFAVEDGYVGVDEYDVVSQGLVSHHYGRGGALRSIPFRYVWPSELDLMARIAGLELHERVAGWGREPFVATSRSHVSVWRKK